MPGLSLLALLLAAGAAAAQADPADGRDPLGASGEGLDDLYNAPSRPDDEDDPGDEDPGREDDDEATDAPADEAPEEPAFPDEIEVEDPTAQPPDVDDPSELYDRKGEAYPRPPSGDDDEERVDNRDGWFHRFFPLTRDDDLDPRTGELQSWFFLGGLLPAGQLWLPVLVADDPMPDGYGWSALGLLALHLLPHLACFAALPCSFVFFGIPVVGQILVLSAFFLNVVNVGCFLANNYYFTPVALLNEYDRRIKAAGTAELHPSDRRQGEPIPF